jgi:outer membrane protein assembly factor BamD
MMTYRMVSLMAWRPLLATAVVAAALGGCASSANLAKALNPDPPGKMFAVGDALMAKGRFDEAAKKFEDLDRDHPYAPEARRAMVLAAFAYYKGKKYPDAIATARRYTTTHPGTKDAALAHHVIASSYFAEIKDPHHDQTAARRALVELKILVSRYPESNYARSALNRIRICEDSLAASEMIVGRYYLKQGQFVAAINRFKTVVKDYQTTKHIEEALHRLVEANVALGILPEAQSAASVLAYNYPQSEWYQNSYALLGKQGVRPQETQGSWISRQWKKIVPGTAGPAAVPVPAAATVPPQQQPATPPAPSNPAVQPLPPEQVPAADLPTASTNRANRPMGLMN